MTTRPSGAELRPTHRTTRAARARRGAHAAVAVLAVAFALAGCGGTSSGAATGTTVAVTMHDFGFHVAPQRVPAGRVTLRVTNDGPSTHEINIDRTRDAPGAIPLQTDGLTADEEAAGLRRIGSIEQVDLHDTRDLTVTLRPGRYVLWCNLEGHYLGGMHHVLDVVEQPAK